MGRCAEKRAGCPVVVKEPWHSTDSTVVCDDGFDLADRLRVSWFLPYEHLESLIPGVSEEMEVVISSMG